MLKEILRVDQVTKRFEGVVAVDNVSIGVAEREIVGLLGANGAGKTTLLDVIGGEQRADAGAVLLDAMPMNGPPHARAKQGLARTFQHPKVSPELTVLENVAVGLAGKDLSGLSAFRSILSAVLTGRRPLEAVRTACNDVGLDRLDRPARLLSFGELRLVEVARALIQEPRALLLDEPYPGLEDEDVTRLSEALRSLAHGSRCIVIVDHNVSLIEGLVDRVVLLARGRVAFDGPVKECVASEAFQEEYIGVRRS